MQAANNLREAIVDNLRSRLWRPGHRLPPERELGAHFGLSRSTVRRVLREFKQRGVITQTVGSGTYVGAVSPTLLASLADTASQQAHAISPAELMSARLAIEPALIEIVIGNATATDFARMDECNDRAETATTLEDFELWDAKLHEAIADAAHNGFISGMSRLVNEARAMGEWGMLKRRSATPERRIEYQHEHRALVAALKQRDVERARLLCRAHLLHVRTNLLGY